MRPSTGSRRRPCASPTVRWRSRSGGSGGSGSRTSSASRRAECGVLCALSCRVDGALCFQSSLMPGPAVHSCSQPRHGPRYVLQLRLPADHDRAAARRHPKSYWCKDQLREGRVRTHCWPPPPEPLRHLPLVLLAILVATIVVERARVGPRHVDVSILQQPGAPPAAGLSGTRSPHFSSAGKDLIDAVERSGACSCRPNHGSVLQGNLGGFQPG